ncbi:hypothetical protein T03_3905 [Trichinella britovi]|uniref:Uncharacterized protein n=1 Tax=Trichinella britovi TaxID=45882 RepID=A0A0V1DEX7_TRIBR|nr:hypothetical protein T03_3905 [Trichinella britovi]
MSTTIGLTRKFLQNAKPRTHESTIGPRTHLAHDTLRHQPICFAKSRQRPFGQIGHLNRMLVWVLLSPMAEFYTAFNIDDKHVQCERAYFSSNVKLNHSLTSLGKFDQAPDEHCTVIVHIPPHRAFAVKSNSRVGSIVTFDVFTNYDIVNGECQNWKRKTSCYLFMKQLSEGHQESLTAMHARVTNPSASSRHLAKASKDNSIFRRLADYCGGQRPFSSSLTIARQLRGQKWSVMVKEE